MKFQFELVPLVVNVAAAMWYVIFYEGPGKILYWLGAAILTVGIMMMRG